MDIIHWFQYTVTSCAQSVVLSPNVAREHPKIKKVGIYVGAFDPIHDGHVAFAAMAVKYAHLDKVFFVVEPSPRHKQGVKALEHRTAMVNIAIKNEPRFGLLLLDEKRPSLLETWPRLQARFKDAELVMLMGDDVAKRISHWPRVDGVVTSVQFVVGTRKDNANELNAHLRMIAETRYLSLAYDVFKVPTAHVSSRGVRRELRQGVQPDGVDDEVWDYIQENHLYHELRS